MKRKYPPPALTVFTEDPRLTGKAYCALKTELRKRTDIAKSFGTMC